MHPIGGKSARIGVFLALLLVTSALAGCASSTPPRVVSPATDTFIDDVPSDAKQQVAVMHLRRSAVSSQHFIMLRGAEEPHVHDRSDLTVFVLRGAVVMHFEDRTVKVGPGDVVDIPMGAFHWAENVADEPSLAYAVYSPAFDGKDRRRVPPKTAARPRSTRVLAVPSAVSGKGR
jgi:mannose-6-phosphate isomerase-like protein (cupin superfamily)